MQGKLTCVFTDGEMKSILMKVGSLGFDGWKKLVSYSRIVLDRYREVLGASRLVYRSCEDLPVGKKEISLSIKVLLLHDTIVTSCISKQLSEFESLYVDLSCFQELPERDLLKLNEIVNNAEPVGLEHAVNNPTARKVSSDRMELYKQISKFGKDLYEMLDSGCG